MHDTIPPPPRRVRLRGALAVIGVLLLIVVGLQHWNTSTYALTPGDATPVGPLVKVTGLSTDPHHDTIMLTDVYLTRLTAWQWITSHFQSHVQYIPASDLVDPGVPVDELDAQGFLQMSDSKQAAEVAALRALGWHPRATPAGAAVVAVIAGSPARRAGLHVADRIVAVGHATVTSACALVRRVHDLAPGARVTLSVERARIDAKGAITWGAARYMSLTTQRPPADLGGSSCAGVSGAARSWLGISPEDSVSYDLPGTISIDTSYIGGPSAGLAMTLTLIDQLSEGSLTGHHVIAATGTIDATGAVGDVGGVAEKTVAVERAGARVFLVPSVEVATARANARPGLRVIGVNTLSQALAALRRLGGAAPVPLTTPH